MNTVKIINSQWSYMRLQIRRGNNSNAENNDLVFDQTLLQGESTTIKFEIFIFYRRDSIPNNPNGTYTTWTQCFNNQTIDNP